MASVPIIELTQVDNGEKFYPLTHVDAVVGLDNLSFFTLDESGNVTLRPQYQNLWVPGWLAAGGVGTSGSGGGGLIETVYTWTELQAMASAPADDVTAAVNARGVYEIWQAVKALQNSTPNVSLVNGSGSSTITVNSVSAEFYTKGQVDNLIGGLVNFHYEFAASTSAVTNPQSNVLYLIGPTGSGADKYEEYVYTDSTWKKIGDTSIDVSQFVTELGTSGNYLTWTKNGTTNNITVPFATKATQDGGGNTIASTYLKLTGGTVTGNITASKFIKSGSSDSYVLLGGGGTKALSGFVTLDKPYQMPTNPFGGSSSSIHQNLTNDGMYAAHKRFNVTLTGLTGNASKLFDGNYETSCNISAGGTGTILIESDTPLFGTYTYGYTILSFYHTGIPESVSMRFYGKRGGTIGWYDANAASYYYGSSASTTNVALSIYNANTYSVSKIEITVTAKDSIATKITQIDHMFNRGATVYMSAVTKFPVKQDLWGPVEINNTLAVTSPITLSGSTNLTRRIYFGDTDHFLELDQYGFHFSHGVYSDDFVSAGGIGSSSSSGGSLKGLVDVELSESLDDGDLLKYDGTHWVNVPQSAIVPTVSVSFADLTSHPTTLSGYGITDAKIQGGTITLGSNSITPLTSVSDLSNTYLSLANGGTVAGAVDFGSGISGGQDWSINDRGEAAFADLTVNGSQVLTSHQTVTDAAATLTPGTTQTIATIGNESITVQVPLFAMQQDIVTLNSYFTNGSANNALKLENHAASYFATATSVTDLTTRVTSLESMFEIVDGNVHVKNSMGLWSDSFISSGGVGTSGGGGGYGVEDITTEEDGTIKFHWTGGDVTTVDLNHTHAGLLPDVTSSDNGKIVKVVNGEWALAAESGGGGGSSVSWGTESNNTVPLTVDSVSKTLLLSSAKVTSLSSSSTDYQVPSAKCVYDIVGDIETLLAAL